MQKIVKCMRFKSILKPNYFKKQRFSIIVFTIIPKVNIDPKWSFSTGNSLSEALFLASTNPQYDNRLFIDLPVQYKKIPRAEHVKNVSRTCYLHKLF